MTTASCFKSRNTVASEKSNLNTEDLTQRDFMERLEIKIEVYRNGPNGSYLTDGEQDHQSWKIDGADNFKGSWVSNSKKLGNVALEYNFTLLEDGRISLEMNSFETDVEKSTDTHVEFSKHLGTVNYVFKDMMSLTLGLNRFEVGPTTTMIAFTPFLKTP